MGGFMPLNPGNVISNLRELRDLTANADGAQRVAFTPTWLKAREWFGTKLIGLPVERHFDAAGNQWITLRGASEKTLVLGSHLDSVPNGGWLDGCLGVVAALEVLRYLAEKYDGKPPFTVRLVDWADEEGARFGRSLFGSAAFAGTQTIAADRGRTDRDGITLEAALQQVGIDIDRIGDAAAERKNIAAYLELHIEQGPVLENADSAAGRGHGHQRRGALCHHLHRARGALGLNSHGGAARCAGCRGETGARDTRRSPASTLTPCAPWAASRPSPA